MAISPYETVNATQYMEQMYRATYNDLVYTEGHLPGETATLTPSRLSKNVLGINNKYNIFDKDVENLFGADGKVVSDAATRYSADWLGEAKADTSGISFLHVRGFRRKQIHGVARLPRRERNHHDNFVPTHNSQARRGIHAIRLVRIRPQRQLFQFKK